MNFPSSTRTPPSLAFVVTLAAVIHCVSASFHVYTGGMNPDEGFYAIAARAVMHGEVPYRDFGYTQMPLLPYVNGPWLALTGYGLFEQRWLNGIWGALALVLASRWVARQTWPPDPLKSSAMAVAPSKRRSAFNTKVAGIVCLLTNTALCSSSGFSRPSSAPSTTVQVPLAADHAVGRDDTANASSIRALPRTVRKVAGVSAAAANDRTAGSNRQSNGRMVAFHGRVSVFIREPGSPRCFVGFPHSVHTNRREPERVAKTDGADANRR